MPATNPLVPGTRVGGKYELVRRLAVGGMGEVWVARNQATGADVAVKLCAGPISSEVRERFRQEARLGAMLSHRSIVRVFDLLEELDGRLLLIMELLRGETLEQYLQGCGSLPTKDAIAIAVPILSALAHAHDKGLIHRDVSPANIFLGIDPDGYVTPKLVDFGIAKLPSSVVKTMDGQVLGTPRYMSPEQIRAEATLDGRSDLFSVGAVLYEMAAGVSPFAASTPAASLAAVLEAVVDPDSRLAPEVWLELKRALSKRSYERHRTAREFADALLAACGETEASLASLLRRAPPSSDENVADSTAICRVPSVAGYRAASPEPRRTTLVLWAIMGAALFGVVGAALGLAFRQSPAPVAPVASTSSTPAASVLASASERAQDFIAAPDRPTSNASTPARTARPAYVPIPTRRSKPVGTTPGF